jgi:hypothetical protein
MRRKTRFTQGHLLPVTSRYMRFDGSFFAAGHAAAIILVRILADTRTQGDFPQPMHNPLLSRALIFLPAGLLAI